MKIDAKTITALAAILTALGGGAEMRYTLGKLEAKLDSVDHRVERIEREIDARHTYAAAEFE